MLEALTSSQIKQYIDEINDIKRINKEEEIKAKVEKACQIYDILNKRGYHYAGWGAGVARGDSITGVSALNFLKDTTIMGLSGEACRNLTSDKINLIRVDMAIGYLETLKNIADDSGKIAVRDVNYKETQKFHEDAFKASNLTLDNWTLKTPMDLIQKTLGDEVVENVWTNLRNTGGTGPQALFMSFNLTYVVGLLSVFPDPSISEPAQTWIDNTVWAVNWTKIKNFLEAGSGGVLNEEFFDLFSADKNVFIFTISEIATAVNSLSTQALNWVPPRRDPLVLDLDGNGITTSGINPAAPILFDQDGDGIKNATGWIASGEAIVVRDLNGNGTIDSGRELFGDNTILTIGPKAGQTAANGFEALADLDSSHYLCGTTYTANDAHIKLRA